MLSASCCHAVVLFCSVLLAERTPVATGETIGPPDVYVRVGLLKAEVELIRVEMGRPKVIGHAFDVKGASPRDVYFQAQTLLKKANRLCVQFAQEPAALPLPPDGEILPRHVFAVVDTAVGCVQVAKEALGIPEQSIALGRDGTRSPTDVFKAITQINRQLNVLLDKPFSPGDVFQRVTLAIHNATAIRAHFPGPRIPDAPAFQRKMEPRNVFERLVRCCTLVREISRAFGVDTARVRGVDQQPNDIHPGDVYDLASLLVSELAYLRLQLTGVRAEDHGYPPGRKLPSHVYQRAGLLEAQLKEIAALAAHHPSRLREGTKSK